MKFTLTRGGKQVPSIFNIDYSVNADGAISSIDASEIDNNFAVYVFDQLKEVVLRFTGEKSVVEHQKVMENLTFLTMRMLECSVGVYLDVLISDALQTIGDLSLSDAETKKEVKAVVSKQLTT